MKAAAIPTVAAATNVNGSTTALTAAAKPFAAVATTPVPRAPAENAVVVAAAVVAIAPPAARVVPIALDPSLTAAAPICAPLPY